MLAEFCFTPSVFDQEANTDVSAWIDQLRELGSSMFPNVAACPVVVTNHYSGSWHEQANQMVELVADHRARDLCQRLLKKMATVLVQRPIAIDDWPVDEVGWAREALATHRIEPIERIIVSSAGLAGFSPPDSALRSIGEVTDSGFWHGISASCSAEMKIDAQVQLLRKVCLHSEFLCVVSPYIFGGGDDDTDFVVSLIQSARGRPDGYGAAAIDVHATAPERGASEADADYQKRVQDFAERGVGRPLRKALGAGDSVELYLWPKMLERYIIGGLMVPGSQGIARSPRWGVHLGHIARVKDQGNAGIQTHWHLLPRGDLGVQFKRFCESAASERFHFTITKSHVTGQEAHPPRHGGWPS